MKAKAAGELIRGNLDLVVLSALASGPKYGYLIQQSVASASKGLVAIQAGTLYPLLHRLEAEKVVRSRWDDSTGRRRKWYELTAAGEKRLHHQARQWHEYAECLWGMVRPILDGPCPAERGA